MAETPQVSKQHAVPQEVFGVQFKLVGDLTLRQFVVLAAFGLVAVLIFTSGLPLLPRWLLTLVFGLGGVAFALVPIQDQPLDQWVGTLIRAVYAPTRRIWEKSTESPEFLTLEIPKLKTPTEPGVTAEESRRRLKAFLAESRAIEDLTPLDIEEQQTLNQINVLARQLIPAPAVASAPAVAPAVVAVGVPTGEVPPVEKKAPVPAPAKEEEVLEAVTPVLPELKFVEVRNVKERPSLASRINWAEQIYKVQRGESASYFAPRKNIRVGRRLTPIAISGSLVYAPVRERTIEPAVPVAPQLPPLPSYPQEEAITPALSQVPPPPAVVPPSPPLKPAPVETSEKIEKPQLQEEVPPIKEEKPAPPPPTKALPALKAKPAPKPVKPQKMGERSNLLFGIAHNPQGGALENTLLVIKNAEGNVVRATKTNELGRFQVGPLNSGSYTLELPQSPYPFATIKVELTGEKTAELDLRPQEKS